MLNEALLIGKFLEYGLVKKGNFTLKSGKTSNIYFDLRAIVSYPELLQLVGFGMREKAFSGSDSFDVVCGVPYGAIAIASHISTLENLPMILKRKEMKKHGTGKMLEGNYKKGGRCLLVEDVITSGKSLIETIKEIEKENVKVQKIVCLLDRQEGGSEKLKSMGYNIESLLTKEQLLNHSDQKAVAEKQLENPVAQKIIQIQQQKKTNICVASDFITTQEVLDLAKNIGDSISILKLHVDILRDFSSDFLKQLKAISKEKNFLLWEDRKFTDIGSVVQNQFTAGIYQIANWADMVTLNPLPGALVLDAFRGSGVGVIMVNKMSSAENLMDLNYQYRGMKMIQEHQEMITGIVTQNNQFDTSKTLIFSPGVSINTSGDNMGQQYNSPKYLKEYLKTDVFVVGRAIYRAKNPKQEAERFRKECLYRN